MIVAMAASVVLVVTTILILYETLRLTSNHLAELPLRPRARIIAVVLATFVGHTAAVWTYAFAYWVLAVKWRIGGFAGLPVESFQDCLYFSVVTYTSLGFGDQVPVSHARLIAGVEALNGLLLIGWSASFTYLAMERYWPLHAGRKSTVWHRRRGGIRQHVQPASSRPTPTRTPAGIQESHPNHQAHPDPSAKPGSSQSETARLDGLGE